MSESHYEQALGHVAAVKAARVALREEYRKPVHDRGRIARFNNELGDALRLAQIEALLHLGDVLSQDRRRSVTLISGDQVGLR